MTTYDKAFEIIIGHEGGFQKNPNDKGNYANGRLVGTKYGISARTYPNEDIPNLTLDRAKFLYKRDFWDAIGGDNLDPKLALVAFDTAVNSGPGVARRFLRQTGDYNQFLNLRLDYLRSLSDFRYFGDGWVSRVNTLRRQAETFTADTAPQPQEQAVTPRLIFVDGVQLDFTKASVVGDKWYINTK